MTGFSTLMPIMSFFYEFIHEIEYIENLVEFLRVCGSSSNNGVLEVRVAIECCSWWFQCSFCCDWVGFMFPKDFEGIHLILDELGYEIEKKNFSAFLGWGLGRRATHSARFFPLQFSPQPHAPALRKVLKSIVQGLGDAPPQCARVVRCFSPPFFVSYVFLQLCLRSFLNINYLNFH